MTYIKSNTTEQEFLVEDELQNHEQNKYRIKLFLETLKYYRSLLDLNDPLMSNTLIYLDEVKEKTLNKFRKI